MLMPLEIPPGVYRNGTDMQSSGRWRDSNLIRWVDGALGPIGGWRSFGDTTLNAAPRGAHSWVTNTGTPWVAMGTYSKLYVVAANGTTSDVTPAGFTSGREDASQNTGYGGGFYGLGTYGTPRPETGAFSDATVWTMDNWGENLVACSPDDGKLYEWTLSTGTAAAAISNAPTGCTAVVVTDERFVFALGASSNDRSIKWSDREDNTAWTPSATNEAGSIELATTGAIKKAIKLPSQTLILTTVDAHAATYLGPPFTYGFERVGTACGIVAPQAGAALQGVAYWMGREGFYAFAGGSVEPLTCDVADYLFNRINRDQQSKIFAVTVGEQNEIWWFYPSSASVEIDSYVKFNPTAGIWDIGTLERTAGVDAGASRYPVWFDGTGDGYQHEVTTYAWGGGSIYAESGPISSGLGENTFSVLEMIPDERTQGEVTATFKARMHPNDTERSYGPYSMANPTSVRLTGRQVRLRVDATAATDWRFGIPRLRVAQRGIR